MVAMRSRAAPSTFTDYRVVVSDTGRRQQAEIVRLMLRAGRPALCPPSAARECRRIWPGRSLSARPRHEYSDPHDDDVLQCDYLEAGLRALENASDAAFFVAITSLAETVNAGRSNDPVLGIWPDPPLKKG